MATMKDIAGLVGVSLTTVSNVVHGNYDRVSPQTVQRILAAIDELHYVPNMSARALVSHSSRIIAYVDTHSPQETYAGNGFAGVMLSGLESVVTDHGYFLMTRRGTDEDVLRLMLNNWNPDGVIFKDRVPQSLVDFVKKQGKPCVTINTYLDDPTLIQVRAEDRRGGYLAAKHLIDLGHRNILFIGAVHCGFMNNDQRYAGYCDALEEAGIAPNPDNLMTNLFPFNAGAAAGRAAGFHGHLRQRRSIRRRRHHGTARRRRARAGGCLHRRVRRCGYRPHDVSAADHHSSGWHRQRPPRGGSDFRPHRRRKPGPEGFQPAGGIGGAGDDGEGEITVSPAERPHFIFTSYK